MTVIIDAVNAQVWCGSMADVIQECREAFAPFVTDSYTPTAIVAPAAVAGIGAALDYGGPDVIFGERAVTAAGGMLHEGPTSTPARSNATNAKLCCLNGFRCAAIAAAVIAQFCIATNSFGDDCHVAEAVTYG